MIGRHNPLPPPVLLYNYLLQSANSNRYTARIEITVTHSKQTTVVLSNRYKKPPPPGGGVKMLTISETKAKTPTRRGSASRLPALSVPNVSRAKSRGSGAMRGTCGHPARMAIPSESAAADEPRGLLSGFSNRRGSPTQRDRAAATRRCNPAGDEGGGGLRRLSLNQLARRIQ
jgi:hypothetical protein